MKSKININNKPIYHGKRLFLGLDDLVISLYTKKCQFQCAFCQLPTRSSSEEVSDRDIIDQIEWIFCKYENELKSFKQVSVGNEGSILDRQRMPSKAMEYFIKKLKSIPNLQVVSLESRPEYINKEILKEIQTKTNNNLLDITVGFETQDDVIRNGVLNKKIDKDVFEKKIRILGSLGIRLTSYVMLKPDVSMTEEEGIIEANLTVRYLKKLCDKFSTKLVIYLNPTYLAKGSLLANRLAYKNLLYEPPKIQSTFNVVLETARLGIPIYTGLWNEQLAEEEGDYHYRNDYNNKVRTVIKNFNQTQDTSTIFDITL